METTLCKNKRLSFILSKTKPAVDWTRW